MDYAQLVGPALLFALMILVGVQLTPEDFRRVLTAPRAVVGGTLAQLLLLPLMTWGVLSLVTLSPAFGAGAVLLAASPGAGLSNVMTAVARAHVALSVTLTGVSSVLAVVTLPVLTALGIRIFLGDAARVEVPVGPLVRQLLLFLLIPIGLGMWLRMRRPESIARNVARANRVAILAIVGLTALGASRGDMNLPAGAEFAAAAAAALAWTLAAMAIGWGVAAALRLDANDRFTLLVEFSARNVALAFLVALGSLGRLDLALFAGTYAATGFPLVIALAVLRGRRTAGPGRPAR
jgi:BASS family bile acid:Na+ symporter